MIIFSIRILQEKEIINYWLEYSKNRAINFSQPFRLRELKNSQEENILLIKSIYKQYFIVIAGIFISMLVTGFEIIKVEKAKRKSGKLFKRVRAAAGANI